MCLGCHATGAEAEEWEKDETFHLEDGVQCEKCHGPGSEYMDEEVMTDPDAARAAGLMMPQKSDCMNCHKVKGSHVAVLKAKNYDVDEAWELLKHPTPEKWEIPDEPTFPAPADAKAPKHVGFDQVRRMSQIARDGLPVQQVADEPARVGVRAAGHAARARDRRRSGRARRPADRPGLPEMPHDRLSRSRRRARSIRMHSMKASAARPVTAPAASSPWKPSCVTSRPPCRRDSNRSAARHACPVTNRRTANRLTTTRPSRRSPIR